ncbi:unnamed protein product [Amoebophrya sp. A120]|nr:unnamed protein product [Amoebophrya sp. A120]|eukprot:GSA120T00018464001.1
MEERLVSKLERDLFGLVRRLPVEHELRATNKGIDAEKFRSLLETEGVPSFHPVLFGKVVAKLPPEGNASSVNVTQWLRKNGVIQSKGKITGALNKAAQTTTGTSSGAGSSSKETMSSKITFSSSGGSITGAMGKARGGGNKEIIKSGAGGPGPLAGNRTAPSTVNSKRHSKDPPEERVGRQAKPAARPVPVSGELQSGRSKLSAVERRPLSGVLDKQGGSTSAKSGEADTSLAVVPPILNMEETLNSLATLEQPPEEAANTAPEQNTRFYRPATTPRFTEPLSIASSPEGAPLASDAGGNINQSCVSFNADNEVLFDSKTGMSSTSSPGTANKKSRSPSMSPKSNRSASSPVPSKSRRKMMEKSSAAGIKTKNKEQEAAEEFLFNAFADGSERLERQDVGAAFLQRDVDLVGSLTVSQALAMLVDLGLGSDRNCMAMLREATREAKEIPYVAWLRKYGKKRLMEKQSGLHIFGNGSPVPEPAAAPVFTAVDQPVVAGITAAVAEHIVPEAASEQNTKPTPADVVAAVAEATEQKLDEPVVLTSRKAGESLPASPNVVVGLPVLEDADDNNLDGLSELLQATGQAKSSTPEAIGIASAASRQAVGDLVSKSLLNVQEVVVQVGEEERGDSSASASATARPLAGSLCRNFAGETGSSGSVETTPNNVNIVVPSQTPAGASTPPEVASSNRDPAPEGTSVDQPAAVTETGAASIPAGAAVPGTTIIPQLSPGAPADAVESVGSPVVVEETGGEDNAAGDMDAPEVTQVPEVAVGSANSTPAIVPDERPEPSAMTAQAVVAPQATVANEPAAPSTVTPTAAPLPNSSSSAATGTASPVTTSQSVAPAVAESVTLAPAATTTTRRKTPLPPADDGRAPASTGPVSGASGPVPADDVVYPPQETSATAAAGSSSSGRPVVAEGEAITVAYCSHSGPLKEDEEYILGLGMKLVLTPPKVENGSRSVSEIDPAAEGDIAHGTVIPPPDPEDEKLPRVRMVSGPAAAATDPNYFIPIFAATTTPGVNQDNGAASTAAAPAIAGDSPKEPSAIDVVKIKKKDEDQITGTDVVAGDETPKLLRDSKENPFTERSKMEKTDTQPSAVLANANKNTTIGTTPSAADLLIVEKLALISEKLDNLMRPAAPAVEQPGEQQIQLEAALQSTQPILDPPVFLAQDPPEVGAVVDAASKMKENEIAASSAPADEQVNLNDLEPEKLPSKPLFYEVEPVSSYLSGVLNSYRIPVYVSAARTVLAATVEGNTLYTETLTLREDKAEQQQQDLHPVQEQLSQTWEQRHVPNPNVLNPSRFGREDYFTHRAMSLGADAVDFRSPLRWLSAPRLKELKAHPDERAAPWPLVPENLSTFSHQLAHLGLYSTSGSNACLLAALVVLADFPELVHRVFANCRDSTEGEHFYFLRLYLPSADFLPGEVAVNDRIPCCATAQTEAGDWQNWRPCFGRYGGALWPYLLEKALAKLFGSYAMLNGISPCLIWSVLTGGSGYQVYFPWSRKQETLVDVWGEGHLGADSHFTECTFWDVTENALSPAAIWESLKSLTQEGHLVGCNFIALQEGSNLSAFGLLAYQYYSVVECKDIIPAGGQDRHRLLKIRNPYYMFDAYSGSLSRDEEWVKLGREVTRQCKLGPQFIGEDEIGAFLEQVSDPTTFWMTWPEFQSLVYSVVFSEFPLQGLLGRSKVRTLSLMEQPAPASAVGAGGRGVLEQNLYSGGASNKSVRFSAEGPAAERDGEYLSQVRVGGNQSRSPTRAALRSSGGVDLATNRGQGVIADAVSGMIPRQPLVLSADIPSAASRPRARTGSSNLAADFAVGAPPASLTSTTFNITNKPGPAPASSSTYAKSPPGSPSARIYGDALRGVSTSGENATAFGGKPVAYPAKANLLVRSPARLPGLYSAPSMSASSNNYNLANPAATVQMPSTASAMARIDENTTANSEVLQTSYHYTGGQPTSVVAPMELQSQVALPSAVLPPPSGANYNNKAASSHYIAPVIVGSPTPSMFQIQSQLSSPSPPAMRPPGSAQRHRAHIGPPPTSYPQLRSPSEAGFTDAAEDLFLDGRPSAPPEEEFLPDATSLPMPATNPEVASSMNLRSPLLAGIVDDTPEARRRNYTSLTPAGGGTLTSRPPLWTSSAAGAANTTPAVLQQQSNQSFNFTAPSFQPIVTSTSSSFDLRAATTAPLTPPSINVNINAITNRTPPKSKKERDLPVWMQQALTVTRRKLLTSHQARTSLSSSGSGGSGGVLGSGETPLDAVSKLALFHDLCRTKGGGIDQLRFQSLVSEHNPDLSDQHLDALWQACDRDGDDLLSYQEFAEIF